MLVTSIIISFWLIDSKIDTVFSILLKYQIALYLLKALRTIYTLLKFI